MDPDIASALSAEQAADQTIIDGKQIPLEFAPTNPSDYDGSTFTAKQFGLTETITVIATSTKTTTPTTTVTVVVEPTAKADCAYWITAFGWYTFEVYNIDGWSTDGGSRLKSEEKGCGALTGWDWRERTSSKYAGAYFNLPFFMKDGCVERAIVSAGGPKLSCDFTGYDIGVAFLPAKKRSASEEMVNNLPELRRRQYISDTPSLPSRSTTQSTTYSQEPTYSPEPWGPGDTVTFTTTIESVTKSTYTTEILNIILELSSTLRFISSFN
ncbi:hypothetical protein BDP55DRAFT_729137 [Colletotrichum godetiae]|uniref:Uncharacterized protein n=1 Tax=Colletotrichum godetiae TaxID=1209918 RepID=A0AAJ0AM12_9PEZI|nr:uncharacterized protein BDP55DRAFT_729137 [Colletotrichum godetiae]KAK1674893.1 hypothetical protein BDP55DRAFT_729137 [Colletotrichum godetiae]